MFYSNNNITKSIPLANRTICQLFVFMDLKPMFILKRTNEEFWSIYQIEILKLKLEKNKNRDFKIEIDFAKEEVMVILESKINN